MTAAPPVVSEKKQTKEFKDANGRTVYVVDVVLPEISENIEQSMIDYVNGVTNKFFENACDQAESNIESASSFMDNTVRISRGEIQLHLKQNTSAVIL